MSIRILVIIFLLPVVGRVVFAGDFTDAHIAAGRTNAGTDFWFSLPPAFEGDVNYDDVAVHLSAPYATEIDLEIPVLDIKRRYFVKANATTEISLTPTEAQPFTRGPRDSLPAEVIYHGAAVNIRANFPVVASVQLRNSLVSEAAILTPVHSLGREYVVASYADPGANYSGALLPSTFTVSAVADATTVWVTPGGNDTTGLLNNLNHDAAPPAEYSLNKGDVLVVMSTRNGVDLSGSRVRADKDVAVLSGVYCADVPTGIYICNYLLKSESPVDDWGNQYHLPVLSPGKLNGEIKVFASEPDVRVFRDADEFGVIETGPGGFEGRGYLSGPAAAGAPRPLTFQATRSIGLAYYGLSQDADMRPGGSPYALDIIPTWQYGRYLYISRPLAREGDSLSARENDSLTVNMCVIHELDSDAETTADLEVGILAADTLSWQPFREVYAAEAARPFYRRPGQRSWAQSSVVLDINVVALRSRTTSFCAYLYGRRGQQTYAMRAGMHVREWLNPGDDAPPRFLPVLHSGDGVFSGEVVDVGGQFGAVGLSTLHFAGDSTFNMQLEVEDFEPGATGEVRWTARVQHPRLPAAGVLIAVDRAGNSSATKLEYVPPAVELYADPAELDFGYGLPGDVIKRTIAIINDGEQSAQLTELNLLNNLGDFELVNAPPLPAVLQGRNAAPDNRLELTLRWTAGTEYGPLECALQAGTLTTDPEVFAVVRAEVIEGDLEFRPREFDFGEVYLDEARSTKFELHNRGAADVWVTAIDESAGAAFNIIKLDGVLTTLPARLQRGIKANITVEFRPTDVKRYFDWIAVRYRYENLAEIEVLLELAGEGIDKVSSVGLTTGNLRLSGPPRSHAGGAVMLLPLELGVARRVQVEVFDLRGVKVLTLSPRLLSAGLHELELSTAGLSAGRYFGLLRTAGETVSFQFGL